MNRNESNESFKCQMNHKVISQVKLPHLDQTEKKCTKKVLKGPKGLTLKATPCDFYPHLAV